MKNSEQRFRHIFEHSPAMVYVTDLNGIMLDVNEAGARMLGYESREDVLGLKAAQTIYVEPQERKRFQEIVDRAGSVQDFETSFQRRDGTIIDVMITSTVRRNRKGDVEGYEGFVIDVTDRKRTERALQESEEKYRTVVENSLSAIFIHQGGVFRFVNGRFAEMLGYESPQEIVGRPFWEVVAFEDRSVVKDRGLRREQKEITPTQYAFRVLKKDGSTIWVDMRVQHATYMGRAAVVGNFIDITQSKEAEEEKRPPDE